MRTTGRVSGGRARRRSRGRGTSAAPPRAGAADAEAGGRIRDRRPVIGFHRESIMRVTEARRSGTCNTPGIGHRGSARCGPKARDRSVDANGGYCRRDCRAGLGRQFAHRLQERRRIGHSAARGTHRIEIRVQIALLARPLRGHRNGTQRAALHRFTEGLAGARASSFAASARVVVQRGERIRGIAERGQHRCLVLQHRRVVRIARRRR